MVQFPESAPSGSGIERPAIETVAHAAAEIVRLHTIFEDRAIDLTPEYNRERMAGEEGITWGSFRGLGLGGKPISVPHLDLVMRTDRIIIHPHYNRFYELLWRFDLTRADISPETNRLTEGAGVSVVRKRVGFNPGEAYVANGEQLFRAKLEHRGPTPTPRPGGGLTYSYHSWVGDIYAPVTEIDENLTKLIDQLRDLEPLDQQA
ncbi:MAG TPA: hypothetical protein VF733_01165 [Candidatus Saccharimonadales bacterium]